MIIEWHDEKLCVYASIVVVVLCDEYIKCVMTWYKQQQFNLYTQTFYMDVIISVIFFFSCFEYTFIIICLPIAMVIAIDLKQNRVSKLVIVDKTKYSINIAYILY